MAADLKQLMESKMVEHTEIKKDGPTGRLGYVRDGWSHGEILLKVVCCGSLI